MDFLTFSLYSLSQPCFDACNTKGFEMILRNIEFNRDVDLDIIVPGLRAENLTNALKQLSETIAEHYKVSAEDLKDQLEIVMERDHVSLGEGIAIPALTLKNIRSSITVFARLEKPLSFDSIDNEPIDLICIVISPEQEKPAHLRRLSRISRILKNKELVDKMRGTDDEQTIRALIHNPDGWMMAA